MRHEEALLMSNDAQECRVLCETPVCREKTSTDCRRGGFRPPGHIYRLTSWQRRGVEVIIPELRNVILWGNTCFGSFLCGLQRMINVRNGNNDGKMVFVPSILFVSDPENSVSDTKRLTETVAVLGTA